MLAFVGFWLFHHRLQCNAESDGKNIPPWRGSGCRWRDQPGSWLLWAAALCRSRKSIKRR